MSIIWLNKAKGKENKGVGGFMDIKRVGNAYAPEGAGNEIELYQRVADERKKAYSVQDSIHKLFRKKGIKSRITACLKGVVSEPYIGKTEKGIARYGNLMVCSNVWLCPCCANKIGKKRAIEISKTIGWAYSNGYTVVMLTFTHSHTLKDNLKDLKESHSLALMEFKSGTRYNGVNWKYIKENIGYIGGITGNEVTYGVNGWHWHSHCLYIVKNDEWIRNNEKVLKKRWYQCLKSSGLKIKMKDIMAHGLDIMYDCHATDYLVKMGKNWGADRELTGGARKKAKGKSPFELLLGNQKKEDLFIEYAKAVSLEAKTSQIRYSKGLKELVGLREKTDEELNLEKEEVKEIKYLSIEDWKLILKYKARSLILELAESEEGFIAVCKWLENHYLAGKDKEEYS